jgi:mRNA interferase HigB
LRRFWQSRRADAAIAERDLSAWRTIVRAAQWNNFASLRQTFGSADVVGNCTVFDVGNNRFRLIARVSYGKEIVYILRIMDHAEYDRSPWANDCGCFDPPPARTTPKKAVPRDTKKGRRL